MYLGEKLRGVYPHWYLLVRHLLDQSSLKLHVLPPLTSTRAFILRQRLWGQAGLEPHELLPPTCTRALPHLPLWDQTKEGNASCMHGFSLHTSPASPQLTSTRTFSHPLLWGHTQKLGYASCMHGISPHPSQVHVSFLPTVLQPCRMLLAAVDDERHCQGELVNQTEVEAGLTFSNKSLTEISKALSDVGLESTAKLPAEVALRNYFKRAKAIAHVVDLLKKRVWDDELQKALRSSSVTFDTLLITQVLRVDLPCDVAVSFFQWLKHQCRFEHNEYTYGVMLNTLGRVGRLDEMQQLFDEMKSKGCTVTPVTLSNVMLCFFKAKDMRGVAHHWNTLRRLGTKPSAAIYTAYIDFLVRSKRFTKIAVIFEEMLRVDCLPSSRTYTVFIQHLVDAGNVEAAAKILKAIQTMRVVPSRVTYKIVINGFAKVGNVEMVLELLKEMREHFHRPTKQLMPAVRALQAVDRLEEALTLLGEIWPESVHGISDIVQLSDEDDADAADDSECGMTVWRSVTCSHVGFDVNAFSQALHAWNPKVEEALEQASIQWESSLVLEILRRLRNLESLWPFFHWLKDRAGFKHDSYTCALLIQRILKSRSTLEKKAFLMKELFEGLRKDGMKFTVPMFNLVIRHYVAVGDAEKALDMFNLIKQFGLEPNETSYALIIQGFAKNRQGKKAMELLKEMEEEGFPLDNITCAELITCLGLAGKTERAYALFRSMSASGRSPGPLEYKAIMATYARVGDNGMALKLYEEMRKDGIAPTQDMYEVVVRILQEANRLSDVQVLAEERRLLNFFDGNKKVLQERLLQVLFLFMESMKPRKAQEAYPIATS